MKRRWLWFALVLATWVVGVSSLGYLYAQPGGERGFRGGAGGGPFGGGGLLALVTRQEVQQELQLVDEQQEELSAAAEEMRNRMRDEMRDAFSQMRDLNDDERRARFDEIRSRLESVNADIEKRLKTMLLPHQFDRLKQIDLQMRLQQRGVAALTSGELAETLQLSDEQTEKLERRAAEVQQELQEQIRQLRIEARNKMLEVLTPDQRAKLEAMMGSQFDLPEQSFGLGGRGGRGFGGGNRGGEVDARRRGGRDAERRPARQAN